MQAKVLFVLLYVAIIITSLCANVLVIVVITSSRQLRTVTNMFFVSLALSDSLIAGANMPVQLLYQLHNEWTLGEPLCKLSSYVQGVVVVCSILTLTGIAVDRSTVQRWKKTTLCPIKRPPFIFQITLSKINRF